MCKEFSAEFKTMMANNYETILNPIKRKHPTTNAIVEMTSQTIDNIKCLYQTSLIHYVCHIASSD